ncbi:hypothetical protein [Clostridium magnum]|uniref:Gp37 protein n=1 Tax=Clostridium magnum DSM 2767 TaxID=1121326 RepID=A0A162QMD9_9CLOT|nr:hypothetical protein [Clostridium magnum]KZL88711.1 hypothetical protein CLMAG_60000 [Clostridium magnum DSM 2767]SHJ44229.1 hypothetical protein SAMN02745944_05970 [Clostridium magnum DSM 2767]
MTPTILQDSLIDDLKEQLSCFLLKNIKGEQVNLNIYSQNLPAKKGQKDTDHFPYLIVRVMDGDLEEKQDGDLDDICKIAFVIGVYDDESNYQGYKDVMNIITKMKQRLISKKFYNNQFELSYPLKWLIHDEDNYPYYFGGIETSWKMPQIILQDVEGLI